MKKILTLILVLTLALSLAACGGNDAGETTTSAPAADDTTAAPVVDTTAAPEDTTAAPEETTVPEDTTAPVKVDEPFYFESDGVKIVCGTSYAEAGLPEVDAFEIPSCAFDGSDMIYTYDAFEISAFDEANGSIIYSIYLLDPNVTTPEGLALGDDAARVTELYGEDCQINGDEIVYQRGETLLIILVQNDSVFSIEYRWDF